MSGWINGILGVVNGVIGIFKGLIDFFMGVFTLDFGRAWDGIKQVFQGAWDGIWGIFSAFFGPVIKIVKTLMESIMGIFDIGWNDIGNFISGIWNGIWGFIKGAANGVIGIVENMINVVVGGLNKAGSWLKKIPGMGWIPTIGKVSFARIGSSGGGVSGGSGDRPSTRQGGINAGGGTPSTRQGGINAGTSGFEKRTLDTDLSGFSEDFPGILPGVGSGGHPGGMDRERPRAGASAGGGYGLTGPGTITGPTTGGGSGGGGGGCGGGGTTPAGEQPASTSDIQELITTLNNFGIQPIKLDNEVYTRFSTIFDKLSANRNHKDCGCGGGDTFIEVDIDGSSLGKWAVTKDDLETQKRVVRASNGPTTSRTTPTTTSSVLTVSRQPVRTGCA